MGSSLRRASARAPRRQGGQGLVHGQRQRHHRRARPRDRQGPGAQGALGREPAHAGDRRLGRDLVYQSVRLRRAPRQIERQDRGIPHVGRAVRPRARQARQRLGVPHERGQDGDHRFEDGEDLGAVHGPGIPAAPRRSCSRRVAVDHALRQRQARTRRSGGGQGHQGVRNAGGRERRTVRGDRRRLGARVRERDPDRHRGDARSEDRAVPGVQAAVEKRRHSQGDRRRAGALLVHGLAQRAARRDRINHRGASSMRKLCGLLALAALAVATGALAQTYPTKPIYLYIPFAAGGPTDTLGRNLAQVMGKSLKQQLIVENVVGAGGTIAVARAAKAAPDGYTVLLHHIGMSTAPALYRTLTFDPLKDFEYIGEVADVPMTMVARGNFPAANFKEFLAYVKANKDKVTYANAGLGAASHLCGLLFMTAIQTDFTTVPYKGTAPAMNDLLGGQVDFMCDQTTNTTGQIQGGKVKVYGVTSRKRVPSLPNIPTLDEQGLKGFEVVVWHGLYVPKGTPKPVVDRLNAALLDAIGDADFKANLARLGAEPVSADRARPEALHKLLQSEIAKWGPIIKKAGQYAD